MKRWLIAAVVMIFLLAVLFTNSKWEGDITEGAAEPLASRAGARVTNLMPWNLQGDLQLFIFFAGGSAAGFAAGFYWRKIFYESGNGGSDDWQLNKASRMGAPSRKENR